jgi:uncharacterized membrane protein YhiD involved in acid resistance
VANGAALWIAAATGSAAGFGDWQLAIFGSIFVAVIGQAAFHLEQGLFNRRERMRAEQKQERNSEHKP